MKIGLVVLVLLFAHQSHADDLQDILNVIGGAAKGAARARQGDFPGRSHGRADHDRVSCTAIYQVRENVAGNKSNGNSVEYIYGRSVIEVCQIAKSREGKEKVASVKTRKTLTSLTCSDHGRNSSVETQSCRVL